MSELPECVKNAISARDTEALDDLLSFFHTFGDEKLEPALWSLGYYSFDTYEQRKRGIRAMLNTAPLFPCPFGAKPEHLKKYCNEERRKACPFADPFEAFKRMLKDARLERGEIPVARYLVVEFHFGPTLRLGPFNYNFRQPQVFFVVASRYLLDELWRRGVKLPLRQRDVAGYLLYIINKGLISEEVAYEAVMEVRV